MHVLAIIKGTRVLIVGDRGKDIRALITSLGASPDEITLLTPEQAEKYSDLPHKIAIHDFDKVPEIPKPEPLINMKKSYQGRHERRYHTRNKW